MNNDLEQAKVILTGKKASFVLLKQGMEPQQSDAIGIKPLMVFLRENKSAFKDGVIADKVIGKAAALMAVLGGASAVYGAVMSEAAKQVLENNHIYYEFGRLVPYIENRTRTGRCPMETAVWEIDDPLAAFDALEMAIAELMKNK